MSNKCTTKNMINIENFNILKCELSISVPGKIDIDILNADKQIIKTKTIEPSDNIHNYVYEIELDDVKDEEIFISFTKDPNVIIHKLWLD